MNTDARRSSPVGKSPRKGLKPALSIPGRANADHRGSITQIPRSLSQSAIDQGVSCETTLLEVIRDARNSQQLLFLQWQRGKATIVSNLRERCQFSVPPDLRLPDRILPCGNPRQLLGDLSFTISKFVDLAEEEVFLVSLYILSSWFPDC